MTAPAFMSAWEAAATRTSTSFSRSSPRRTEIRHLRPRAHRHRAPHVALAVDAQQRPVPHVGLRAFPGRLRHPGQRVPALIALRHGVVPGVATLRESDPDLGDLPISARPQARRSDVALVLNRGFGESTPRSSSEPRPAKQDCRPVGAGHGGPKSTRRFRVDNRTMASPAPRPCRVGVAGAETPVNLACRI